VVASPRCDSRTGETMDRYSSIWERVAPPPIPGASVAFLNALKRDADSGSRDPVERSGLAARLLRSLSVIFRRSSR
jgi:hypothetical protein